MHHTQTLGRIAGKQRYYAVEDAQLGSEMTSEQYSSPNVEKELEMVMNMLLGGVRKD